jgi:hypothetical protein
MRKVKTMKATALLFFLLALNICVSGQSQPSTTATTPGNCSVANTGSNNTFTINCKDDKAQGQAILKIVNEILAHQLDTNTVMSKLNELEQVVKKNALHWKLEPAQIDTLTAAFKANVAPACVISAASDADSKDLAAQLCRIGRISNPPMMCVGPGLGSQVSTLDQAAVAGEVVGIGCYASQPNNRYLHAVQKSLATVDLPCEYKGVTFKAGQIGVCVGGEGAVVVVGNLPPKSK